MPEQIYGSALGMPSEQRLSALSDNGQRPAYVTGHEAHIRMQVSIHYPITVAGKSAAAPSSHRQAALLHWFLRRSPVFFWERVAGETQDLQFVLERCLTIDRTTAALLLDLGASTHSQVKTPSRCVLILYYRHILFLGANQLPAKNQKKKIHSSLQVGYFLTLIWSLVPPSTDRHTS